MSSEALLPCPFCGGEPRLSEPRETDRSLDGQAEPEEWIATIDCDVCDLFFMKAVTTSQAEASSSAIAAWNRRATPSPASGELASLVERYSFLKLPGSSTLTPCVRPDGEWVQYSVAASQLAAVAAERDAALEAEDEAKDCFWAIYPEWVKLTGHGISTEAARTDLAERALTAERLLAEAREALTQIASGRDKDGNTVDFFQDIAGEALVTLSPGGSNGQG